MMSGDDVSHVSQSPSLVENILLNGVLCPAMHTQASLSASVNIHAVS